MVFEIQLPVSSLHLPRILNLATCNLRLLGRAPLNINGLAHNQHLRQTEDTQRESVAQLVGCFSVDLSSHNSGNITHRLLHADSGCAAVMRRNVHVEPCDVETWACVDGNSAQEGGEELNAVVGYEEKEEVADDAEDVGKEDKLRHIRKAHNEGVADLLDYGESSCQRCRRKA
jgi:hypothetical protein